MRSLALGTLGSITGFVLVAVVGMNVAGYSHPEQNVFWLCALVLGTVVGGVVGAKA